MLGRKYKVLLACAVLLALLLALGLGFEFMGIPPEAPNLTSHDLRSITHQVRAQEMHESMLLFRHGDLRLGLQSLLRFKREKVISLRLDRDEKATVTLRNTKTGKTHFYRFEHAGESWYCVAEGRE
jgi:hypothetical protein